MTDYMQHRPIQDAGGGRRRQRSRRLSWPGGLTMTGVVATAQTGDPHHVTMMMGGGHHAEMHDPYRQDPRRGGLATPEQKAKVEQILHSGMGSIMRAHDMDMSASRGW